MTTEPRVFDDTNRSDPSPASHSESGAGFLNRVAGPYWDQVRHLVEAWAARLPPAARTDVVARLRSSSDRQSSAAFWELYLHQSFVIAGFTVDVHPKVPTGSRPPDFLLSRGSESFCVEATCIFGSDTDAGAIARRQQLFDALDTIHSPNFFLSIDVKQTGQHAMRTGRLQRELEQWLAGLDPDKVETMLVDDPRGERFDWDERGWQLTFRPIPVRAEARGRPDHRVLGMFGSGEAHWRDDAGALRDTVRAKGRAYGLLDLPLVIAVNVATPFHDDEDTINALFGTRVIQFESDNLQSARYVVRGDGYWGQPGRWSHRHIAGLLLANSIAPWRVTTEIPTLWLHPDPATPVSPLEVWRTATLVEDHIETAAAAGELSRFFRLPDPWPEGEAFPKAVP